MYYASNERDDFLEAARRHVPEAWLTLEMDVDTAAPKQKLSLYLDASVVKMYRAMGRGYQARINRILETWMQMKMAEKTGLYRDLIGQLEVDGHARLDTGEPEDIVAGGKSLAENWSYNEGLIDGLSVTSAEVEALGTPDEKQTGGDGKGGRTTDREKKHGKKE